MWWLSYYAAKVVSHATHCRGKTSLGLSMYKYTLLDGLPETQPRVNNLAKYIVFLLSIGSISNLYRVETGHIYSTLF